MNAMNMFTIILIVQLFFSASITVITYTIPDTSLDYVTSFSDITGQINLESVSGEIQDSLDDQLDIPVVELGALVFYTGNIIIDLLLNFFFAVPEMISLLGNGFLLLFNVDSDVFNVIELFLTVIVTVLYFVGLLNMLLNIRSRGTIV